MTAKRRGLTQKTSAGLNDALAALVAGLKASTRPSMIIGGMAVIARGVPRVTRDIDATVAGAGTNLEALVMVLEQHHIVPRIKDAVRFAQQNHVLLLRHAPSSIDVDLSVAWLPFELEAITASNIVSIHGVNVPVARAEDLVIYKLAAWRPQDQQDIERLIALHGKGMDLSRVRTALRELATALNEPQRMAEFERLLGRLHVGGSSRNIGTQSSDSRTPRPSPAKRKHPSSTTAAQQTAAPDDTSKRTARRRTRRG